MLSGAQKLHKVEKRRDEYLKEVFGEGGRGEKKKEENDRVTFINGDGFRADAVFGSSVLLDGAVPIEVDHAMAIRGDIDLAQWG